MGTSVRWDLKDLLCGLDLDKFKNYLSTLKGKLTEIEERSKISALNEVELMAISQTIKQIESAESFYYCLTVENIDSSILSTLTAAISALKSQVRSLTSNLQEKLINMSDKQFVEWSNNINHKSLIRMLLNNSESTSREESVISNFAKETLNGLEDMYLQVRNNMKVNIEINNRESEISFNEASNLALNLPEYFERIHIFKELNKTLKEQANIFASVYNQMIGIRLNQNKIKQADYLDDSLKLNGLTKPTLNTMWGVVDSNLHELLKFLKIKAKEVGKEKISWHDLLTSTQKTSYQVTFPQAIELITDSLGIYDSEMSDFVKGVIAKGWVDAEQRKTKPPGGFCAPFVPEGESRISLTFDNSIDSIRRLAHELGHAWHYYQMEDVPTLRFSEETFEMTMAETSSIFFETVVIDSIIENTNDVLIKKAILGSKIERSLNYLMSIRGAFLFEEEFYEYRKSGQLEVKLIEELSLRCQEKAYGNSLSEYEPYVWIKYEQFYQANTSFYNYPYSFGFLLSIGFLELAKEDELFNHKFQGFLSESGKLPIEKQIKKHFNIDISQSEFWNRAVQKLIKDIEQYSKVCEVS